MSVEPPTYLTSLQNNVRARPIPWEGAVRAGSITEEQLSLVKAVDKVRRDSRQKTIERDVRPYVSLLAGSGSQKSILESAGRRPDIIQYILVLAGDLVNDVPALKTALTESEDGYRHFLPLLGSSSTEDPIPLLASSVLIGLVSASVQGAPKTAAKDEAALDRLFDYLAALVRSEDTGLQEYGIRGYSSLILSQRAREIFFEKRAQTLPPLVAVLEKAASTGRGSGGALPNDSALSITYGTLLVLWQMSFDMAGQISAQLEEEHGLIGLLTRLLKASPKEKPTRVTLATLRNLLSRNRSTTLPIAVAEKLPNVLGNVSGRHLTDAELVEDHAALSEQLAEYTKTQTTFDEYAAEVAAGHLRWSPPHRDPGFWRDNARRILDAEGGALPRRLAEILAREWEEDKQVLAVACNDVGCLVKEAPERRAQLEKLGLKARVMALMADRDEAVRWESLRAVGEWLRYTFE